MRAASCPAGTAKEAPVPLALTVTPVSLGKASVLASRLPVGVTSAGAWRLQSADRNLGGLSGLAHLAGQDRLYAVSDAGGLVEISLADGAPQSGASIIYLRAADGRQLSGKSENDAEGLVVRDGLAIISFERQFRVEAFAVEACGAAARAAPIAALPSTIGGRTVDENSGPEALSLSADGALTFGYEALDGGAAPLGRIDTDGSAAWTGEKAPNPDGFALVGLDELILEGGRAVQLALFRSYDGVRGARSVLTWGPEASSRLALSRPLLTDNFEGLAGEALPGGGLRIWIVSDDNFSEDQQTLLFAFDVALELE